MYVQSLAFFSSKGFFLQGFFLLDVCWILVVCSCDNALIFALLYKINFIVPLKHTLD